MWYVVCVVGSLYQHYDVTMLYLSHPYNILTDISRPTSHLMPHFAMCTPQWRLARGKDIIPALENVSSSMNQSNEATFNLIEILIDCNLIINDNYINVSQLATRYLLQVL